MAAAGCAFALVYAAYKLTALISLGLGFHLIPDHSECSSLVAAPCVFSVTSPTLAVLLICLGLTLPAVVYPLSQARRRRWELQSFEALGSLWQDLSTAMPEIVLSSADFAEDVSNDSDFLLQRRVIEISDGILALRPYRSRRVEALAQQTFGNGTAGGTAAVEATVVKAAPAASKASGSPTRSRCRRQTPPRARTSAQTRSGSSWWPTRTRTALGVSPTTASQNWLEPEPMTNPTQDPRFLQDPYPTYAAMRSACPVQPVPTGSGGHTSYLVTG